MIFVSYSVSSFWRKQRTLYRLTEHTTRNALICRFTSHDNLIDFHTNHTTQNHCWIRSRGLGISCASCLYLANRLGIDRARSLLNKHPTTAIKKNNNIISILFARDLVKTHALRSFSLGCGLSLVVDWNGTVERLRVLRALRSFVDRRALVEREPHDDILLSQCKRNANWRQDTLILRPSQNAKHTDNWIQSSVFWLSLVGWSWLTCANTFTYYCPVTSS